MSSSHLTATDSHKRPVPAHAGLALLALGLGGFAIGTTEFVSMGLLPQLARAVGVTNPVAGHAISAYALGVVVGAPLIAIFGSRLPRRRLLLLLMGFFAVAHVMTALISSYPMLLLARFLSGLPHGGYFGVAALVAAHLAAPGREGRAVARVMLGLSVANLIGVPAATWLGQNLGWRTAYWLVAVLAALTIAGVRQAVPYIAPDREANWRTEIRALRSPQLLLTLTAGAVGFGGMFAVYTYIVPTLTEVGGLPESVAPIFLFAFGLGMVVGTWVAGELAGWSVFKSLFIGGGGQGVLLLVFAALAPYGWWTLPVLFAITVTGSILVINLQLRLMDVAGEAQTIGAASNHAALNIANALGAWLGGSVIALGWGYQAPGVVGALLALLGCLVLGISLWLHRRELRLT